VSWVIPNYNLPSADPIIYAGPEGILALRKRIREMEELGNPIGMLSYWRRQLFDLMYQVEDKEREDLRAIGERRVFLHDMAKLMGLVYPVPKSRFQRISEEEII
jgi:hypothetical protein